MTKEQGQFDESFGAKVVRPTPAAPTQPEPKTIPASDETTLTQLTADELGAMLCRIKAIRIGTGEEILVVLSREDWQLLMDEYHLVIMRRPT